MSFTEMGQRLQEEKFWRESEGFSVGHVNFEMLVRNFKWRFNRLLNTWVWKSGEGAARETIFIDLSSLNIIDFHMNLATLADIHKVRDLYIWKMVMVMILL